MSLRTGLWAIIFAAALPLSGQAESVLRVGMATGDIGKIDPHLASGTQDKVAVAWMFNGLVRIKPGEASPKFIEPDLAESWSHTPDNLAWTFHLRHGVQCQQGYGEFTADDVVYSLQRAADPARSSFSSDYKAIKSVTAIDKYTVEIDYSQTIPSVLGTLIDFQGGYMVCKAAAEKMGADFNKHPIGTGPFQFKEYTPQQELVLEANPQYFRGKPRIDRIEYRFIPAAATRDLALQNGELDLDFGQSDKTWWERMKKLPHTSVVAVEPTELYMLHLNETHKPLDDIRVRQAVAYAMPREALVKYRGEEISRVAKSAVGSNYLGFTDDVPLLPYDPAKAKALLKEAGYPDGITLHVIQTSLGSMLDTMQVLQGQMRKAGITLDLQVVEHATFHAQIRKDLSDVVYYGAARFPIADTYLSQFFDSASIVGTPGAVTNFSHCKVADDDIRAARTEPDEKKQIALWADAQKKIIGDVCAVPIYELFNVWALSDRVHLGYDLHGALSQGIPLTENSTVQ